MSVQNYTVDPYATYTQIVGIIPEKVIRHFSITCSSREVKMFPGVIKHLQKRSHYQVFLRHYNEIPNIISNPDYVGQNPREPNSLELYKQLSDTVLVAIKLDPSGYLYLSSFYDLHNATRKIQKRLNSGRIIPFTEI